MGNRLKTQIYYTRNGTSMVDITRDEIWDSDYENEERQEKHKGKNKFLKIGIVVFLVTFAINVVLIYSFFNLLSKL